MKHALSMFYTLIKHGFLINQRVYLYFKVTPVQSRSCPEWLTDRKLLHRCHLNYSLSLELLLSSPSSYSSSKSYRVMNNKFLCGSQTETLSDNSLTSQTPTNLCERKHGGEREIWKSKTNAPHSKHEMKYLLKTTGIVKVTEVTSKFWHQNCFSAEVPFKPNGV